ncbi:heat shock protein, class I [Plasmodium gonderi]|uniref:Heat shock protein, class I n=1 Tax=Plasmodium gonderi TaxID=77519 RepID=A0A1Y1JS81_PLAGO|nr:heat shock protein, class I [Plasmodium gonderi]GAW82844.1 heat shock protein, class I [Plasmodium gonderi]
MNMEKPKVIIESTGVPIMQKTNIPILLSTPVVKNMYSTYSYSNSNPISSSYSTSSNHNEYKYNWTKCMTKTPPHGNENEEYIKTFDGRLSGLYYETIPLKSNTNNIFEITPPKEDLNKINYNPKMEIYSTCNFAIIMMDLPGISKENLNVEFENGLLKMFGHKYKAQMEELEKEHEYHTKIIERVSEYYFCKMFQMPPAFSQGQNISCKLKDGELILKILATELKTQKTIVEIQS